MVFGLLDTTGYSAEIQAKYAGMLILERKTSSAAARSRAGAYGFGLQKPHAGRGPGQAARLRRGGRQGRRGARRSTTRRSPARAAAGARTAASTSAATGSRSSSAGVAAVLNAARGGPGLAQTRTARAPASSTRRDGSAGSAGDVAAQASSTVAPLRPLRPATRSAFAASPEAEVRPRVARGVDPRRVRLTSRTCASAPVRTVMRAPMPSRLLLRPDGPEHQPVAGRAVVAQEERASSRGRPPPRRGRRRCRGRRRRCRGRARGFAASGPASPETSRKVPSRPFR